MTSNVSRDGLKRSELAAKLTRARRERGMTQHALAKSLDISQATISKLLRGQQSPRPNLASRIEGFITEGPSEASAERFEAVMAAYKDSAEFRRLCHAALILVNKYE